MKLPLTNSIFCSSCEVELTDKNWYGYWKNVGRTQCTECRRDYNNQSNKNRMYINGKYIPQTHPLYKPGRYKSLDDAWSHNKIESTKEGEVYAIVNSAWPEWVKVGKAVSSEDRLNGYQTSSPFRDYKIIAAIKVDNRHKSEIEMHSMFEKQANERKGEWFNISLEKTKQVFASFT
jgi:hypothetical protein|tara:strand:+ start:1087 stop:1614 length:528 start_codon:yes stop_codon:yes gene_type:complete